jgi:hypothetical protein
MNAIVPAAAIGAALLLGAIVPAPAAANGPGLTVPLTAVSPSTESGTAVLNRNRTIVKIVISVSPEKRLSRQPAHIHQGVCGSFGAVVIPLHDVKYGKSVTSVPAATWLKVSNGPVYIDVHQSNMAYNNILACGNVSVPAKL